MGAEIILPEHYQVANAVGTVVGNVVARQEAEVLGKAEGMMITGYYARVGGAIHHFEGYDEALAFARQELCRLVAEEACAAGAEDPQVECTILEAPAGLPGAAQLSAWAAGKPGLNGLGQS